MTAPLHLFDAYGIELEYMIVDKETLSVAPIADELLKQVGGDYEMEVELGPVAWSNELALHVIEMKTNGPRESLSGLAALFHEHTRRIDELLASHGARLLPTAMHPWMNPDTELRLWSHEDDVIYKTFDRIFDCRGHGWANLQSMHINLPFADDDEFGRLHAAVRLVLPLLPALAASSPFVDGAASGFQDTRLEVYRTNARRIPSVAGLVVPEPVFTRAEYENTLLGGIYRDLAPHDPQGILCHEWVNGRGAIARFDRMAVEIRVLDIQECPQMDIAIAAAVTSTVRALVEERWCSLASQKSWSEQPLAELLRAGIKDADQAVINNPDYLAAFGFSGSTATTHELWRHVLHTLLASDPALGEWQPQMATLMDEGCLARRLTRAAAGNPDRGWLRAAYETLAECLTTGTPYRSAP